MTGTETGKPDLKPGRQEGGNGMKKVRGLAVVAGLVAVLGLAVACSNGEAATVAETPAEPTAGAVVGPPSGAPAAAPGGSRGRSTRRDSGGAGARAGHSSRDRAFRIRGTRSPIERAKGRVGAGERQLTGWNMGQRTGHRLSGAGPCPAERRSRVDEAPLSPRPEMRPPGRWMPSLRSWVTGA